MASGDASALRRGREIEDARIGELERRVDQLEAQLEGLQDAVHSDAVRRTSSKHGSSESVSRGLWCGKVGLVGDPKQRPARGQDAMSS